MSWFSDAATTQVYSLSLHDALPICDLLLPRQTRPLGGDHVADQCGQPLGRHLLGRPAEAGADLLAGHAQGLQDRKSHTSELQSRQYLVCRLLLEKKMTKNTVEIHTC